jgi:hypothetical protein
MRGIKDQGGRNTFRRVHTARKRPADFRIRPHAANCAELMRTPNGADLALAPHREIERTHRQHKPAVLGLALPRLVARLLQHAAQRAGAREREAARVPEPQQPLHARGKPDRHMAGFSAVAMGEFVLVLASLRASFRFGVQKRRASGACRGGVQPVAASVSVARCARRHRLTVTGGGTGRELTHLHLSLLAYPHSQITFSRQISIPLSYPFVARCSVCMRMLRRKKAQRAETARYGGGRVAYLVVDRLRLGRAGA